MSNTNWDGSPIVLEPAASVMMPQAPNGSIIVSYLNQAQQNYAGTLAVMSGSQPPTILAAPALTNTPGILANNWQGRDLRLTNVSEAPMTPILVAAYGPGLGPRPAPLNTGTPLQLPVGGAAQGTTNPNWVQLVFSVNATNLETLAFVGGPPDANGNNAYVIALNAPSDTGPGTGIPAPPGYFATSARDSYAYEFNWGVAPIYVVNLSSTTAPPVTVVLINL
jgi:hypothetical protein